MEITWEKPLSSSTGHHRHPSFSSTLLDQIYRSIDQDSPPTLESTKKKKQQLYRHEHREISPPKHRRSIAADFERSRRRNNTTTDSVFLRYSNSSSSDSSGFSSSESDSFYKHSKSSASPHLPKPIRTSLDKSEKPKELSGFLRTKSKALKIYTDLKKVKQPISPGGRLATFLNSLLPTNPKKPKKVSTSVPEQQQQSPAISSTTCSSASSFSRSCLSKTPSSSSGKSKRSVRFCPVNVILDEEYSSIHMPDGYTNNNKLYGNNIDAKRDRQVMEEENRRVIEAAKDLLRTFQKNKDNVVVEDDEDEDDVLSCASSDLFELENLSAIGIERYREELPVYETTRLDKTNRAIAT